MCHGSEVLIQTGIRTRAGYTGRHLASAFWNRSLSNSPGAPFTFRQNMDTAPGPVQIIVSVHQWENLNNPR